MAFDTYKDLAHGNTDFEDIRTNDGNYVYIDKTRYIELLEDEDNGYSLFVRPYKFGKSLFCSTLANYYDINQADKFEQLFGNLYIGEHPTPKHNTYLVLKFDFSHLYITEGEEFQKTFSKKVQSDVCDFLNRYQHLFPEGNTYNAQIEREQSGIYSLSKAFSATESAGKKLFVIVDGYDCIVNNLITRETYEEDDVYLNLMMSNKTVHAFYNTLKIGTETIVDRIFLTGTIPISLNDLLGGFDIASNLSLEKKYNEMFGFTFEEIQTMRKEIGFRRSEFLDGIAENYDGYLFHLDGKERVYHTSTTLFWYLQFIDTETEYMRLLDKELKADYRKLGMLAQDKKNCDLLTKIIDSQEIHSEIIPMFYMEKLYDNNYFPSLLFYLGILTIDRREQGITYLKAPNYFARAVSWHEILQKTEKLKEKWY
jgi:hypothetical protein